MVEYDARREPLSRTFAALADPTRRAILARLRAGPLNVTAIAAPFSISLAAVSKHLQVLERADLVRREVHGRERRCSLSAAPLSEAAAWTTAYREFWETRLDALEGLLAAHHRARARRRRR